MRGGIGLDDGGGSGIQLMDCFHDAVNGDAIHFEELLVGCALTELILDADLADARTTLAGNNLRNASTETMHDRVVFNRDNCTGCDAVLDLVLIERLDRVHIDEAHGQAFTFKLLCCLNRQTNRVAVRNDRNVGAFVQHLCLADLEFLIFTVDLRHFVAGEAQEHRAFLIRGSTNELAG